jgi:diguanylate cyclase (GGDEF)-like protein
MVVIAASAVAALAAIGVVVYLATAGRRVQRRMDDRLVGAIDRMGDRMDLLAHTVADALARATEHERLSTSFVDVTGSIDLDEVLERTVAAAASIPGVDATIVSAHAAEGDTIVGALGMSEEDAERQMITGPPDGRPFRGVALTYLYSDEDADDAIQSALAVPLMSDTEQLGFLATYSRFPESDRPGALADLEELARRAGPALDNARRFREARQLADIDGLTGLYNRRTFHETLAREIARAQRYNRRLALLVIDMDDFKTVNDRIGHLAGDAVLADTAGRMREVVRSADVPCRIGGDEFAIILPEASLADGHGLFARIQGAMRSRPLSHGVNMGLSAGVAELRPADDPLTLFERADAALYRAKDAGKGTAATEEGPGHSFGRPTGPEPGPLAG